MTQNGNKVVVSILGSKITFFFVIVLPIILGAIQAGGTGAGIYLVFAILGYFSMFLSVIPFGGAFLQYFILSWLRDGLFAFAGLQITWATQLVFWIPMIVGIIINVIFSGLIVILIIVALRD